MNDDENPPRKPRCLHDVIQRAELGMTTKDDADYLLDTLTFASMRIYELERRIAMLQRRLATVH